MRVILFKSMLCLIAIAGPAIAIAQQSFSLKGTFQNLKTVPSAVYMKSMEDTSVYKVPVVNGSYLIKGQINGPTKFNILPIYSDKINRPADANAILFIYLEKGQQYINHFNNFSNLKVTGSVVQAAEDTLLSLIDQAHESGNSESRLNMVYVQYLKAHLSSPIAVYALKEYSAKNEDERKTAIDWGLLPFSIKTAYLMYINQVDIDKALPLYERLPDSLKQSTAGKNLNYAIEWAKLDKQSLPYRVHLDSLMKLYLSAIQQKDTAGQKKNELEMNRVQETMYTNVYVAYIINFPSSPIALDVLSLMGGSNFDNPRQSKALFDPLSDSIKNTAKGIDFSKRLSTALKTAVGESAPDFSQPDSIGHDISLSSYRGKYVLLDFWASWCHPCREQNPNMLKVYNRYKAKGFTILSVSLDTDRKNWLRAIHQDGIPWEQVSDLKIKNQAVKLYDILGIPANLLIGPDGKIVDKNLFGDLLENRLDGLLK
jgi:peroxiredoxin